MLLFGVYVNICLYKKMSNGYALLLHMTMILVIPYVPATATKTNEYDMWVCRDNNTIVCTCIVLLHVFY